MVTSAETNKDAMAKKVYPIRLDEEKVIKPLQEIAESENRTVANLIETTLLEMIKKKRRKK